MKTNTMRNSHNHAHTFSGLIRLSGKKKNKNKNKNKQAKKKKKKKKNKA